MLKGADGARVELEKLTEAWEEMKKVRTKKVDRLRKGSVGKVVSLRAPALEGELTLGRKRDKTVSPVTLCMLGAIVQTPGITKCWRR